MKINNPKYIVIFRDGARLFALIALILSAYQALLQYQENQYLIQVAADLKTGDVTKDVAAAVNFAYTNIRLGEGKYGFLRASALEILEPTIGGQCGEFTRVTVLLLQQMGYSAHRLYLFPALDPGQSFDPKSQASFHVMAEVWTGDRWAAIDPLRGIVFYKRNDEFATVSDLATDSTVVQTALKTRPIEVHQTAWNTFEERPLELDISLYQNVQGFNRGDLTYIPGLFPMTYSLFADQLNSVQRLAVTERPHEMLIWIFLLSSGVVYSLGLVAERRLRNIQKLEATPVYSMA